MNPPIQVQGTIEYRDLGPGTWALVSSAGETYELYHAPSDLKIEGLQVTVQGRIRSDVMTMAMIGPVLEVDSFQVQP